MFASSREIQRKRFTIMIITKKKSSFYMNNSWKVFFYFKAFSMCGRRKWRNLFPCFGGFFLHLLWMFSAWKASAPFQHALEYFWVGTTPGEASRELGEARIVRVIAQGGVSGGRLRAITALCQFFLKWQFISKIYIYFFKCGLLKRGSENHKWIKKQS